MQTFYFGRRDDAMKITADSLEYAIGEFCLSCIDFSAYANHHDPISKTLQKEPFGYSSGIQNPDYSKHRYYEVVTVYSENPYFEANQDKAIYELTLTEFRTFHNKQKNILTHNPELSQKSESREVTSRGMVQMENHIVAASAKIREMKLQMALEAKHGMGLQIAKQTTDLANQLKKIEREHNFLNKKLDILKTYAGIGRDIVKVHSGKKADSDIINIFQSFRYMKEDIELLSDFEDFDARDLEHFDEFLVNNYKKLLPAEKSIQAFKISKFEIEYDDFFMREHMRDANKKVFILARNGDNVYRMFNDYKLHSDKLFMLDNPEEEFNRLVKSEISKNMWRADSDSKNLFDCLKAREQQTEASGYYERFLDEDKQCAIIFDYNENILDTLKSEAMSIYEAEVERRENYIEKYNLQDQLDASSWRWGKSLGEVIYKAFNNYNEVREIMELTKAYLNNDYLTLYALLQDSLNRLGHTMLTGEESSITPNFETGVAVLHPCFYRDAKLSDFSQNFDPITAAPLNYYTIYFDYDKYKESALDKARISLEAKVKSQNFKNFNSMAVLQNILDSKQIFDIEADLIFMTGIDKLNFIKDNDRFLIGEENNDQSNSSIDSLLIDASILKKGDMVYVARKKGPAIYENRGYVEKVEDHYFKKFQIILCKVVSVGDTVKIRGLLDVYKNNSFTKGYSIGEAKIKTEILKDKYLLFDSDISGEDILKKLQNRHFRESQTLHAHCLKELRKMIKTGKEINFSGGTFFR